MPMWALYDDGKEVAAFRGFNNEICREDCETEVMDPSVMPCITPAPPSRRVVASDGWDSYGRGHRPTPAS